MSDSPSHILDQSETSTPLMEISGVDCSYGLVQILFGVSLSIREGEMLALLGTNGAGKSTLLRVISGLTPPDAGTVRFRDEELAGLAPQEVLSRGVVLIPGGKAVFPDMTVTENLEMMAFSIRRDKGLVRHRREKVLAIFPRLADRLQQPAGTLSGGEQQQLALAKALLLEPTLLCIDELSLGLAPVVVESLMATVREINAHGTTVVLVEQSLNVAASLCERAIYLEKGAVKFEGRTMELVESDEIARAVFLGGTIGGTQR